MIARALALCGFLAVLGPSVGPAQQAVDTVPGGTSLRIRQARIELPEIVVYVDVPGLVTAPDPGQIAATLGIEPLDLLDATPAGQTETGVAYIFLIDVSKSLRQDEFEQLRALLQAWIGALEGRDRAAILTAGDHSTVAHRFTADRGSLLATLAELEPTDQRTTLYTALDQALEIAQRRDAELPPRRAIVVLSDGWSDGAGVRARDVMRKIEEVSVPIYAIGYSHLNDARRAYGFDILRTLAESSEGLFVEGHRDSVDAAHERIRRSIDGEWRLRFACPECQGNGRPQVLAVELDGAVVGADRASLRVLPPRLSAQAPRPAPVVTTPPPVVEPEKPPWLWLVVPILLLISITGLLLHRAAAARPADYDPFYGHRIDPSPSEPIAIEPAVPSPSPSPSPGVAGTRIRLVVVRGRRPGRTYRATVPRRFAVGSEAGNTVVLSGEEGVDGVHFEVEITHRGLRVRDLTGRRRTSVNGVPVAGCFEINRDDLILAGRTELRILVEEP